MKIHKQNPLPVHRPLIRNIAFFGDAEVPKTDPVYKESFAIAKILAKHGFTIVNGGGPGVMNASTQGAKAVGGYTIGFSPANSSTDCLLCPFRAPRETTAESCEA